jgi:hypothetical protein
MPGKGQKHSEETKLKIKNARKNQIFSDSTKEKMRKNHRGFLGKNTHKNIKIKLVKKEKVYIKLEKYYLMNINYILVKLIKVT